MGHGYFSSSSLVIGRGRKCAATKTMRFGGPGVWESLSRFAPAASSNNNTDSFGAHACTERTAGFCSVWISNKK